MRRARPERESGQVIVLILIVLAVLGGGWWMMKSNRDNREREAREFAEEATRRVVLQHDLRYLDVNLSPDAQRQYPPSFRMRMLDYIREAGTPNSPQFKMKGTVRFTDQFFDPTGEFLAQFDYPAGPAYFEVHVSHRGVQWLIDAINWTWQPLAPPPTPTPFVMPTIPPTPSPSPSPSTKPHKKKP